MRLLSPEEDFRLYTLDKVEGVLGKARYLASLKEEGGALHHWGLQRQFGTSKAAEVLNKTLTQQVQTLIQESLLTLWQEAQAISRGLSLESVVFLQKLRRDLEEIAPTRLTTLQNRHLNSVMGALFEIAAHQHPTSDSSRIRPPVQ